MIDTNWFFEACEKLKVLVVGDVMTDRYLSGEINRISPEAPVPVLEYQSEQNRPGGAANVALNVQAMGAGVFLGGVVGNDPDGHQLLELCESENLVPKGILISDERMTTVKTRVLASNQHLLRVDREHTFPLSETETAALLKRVKNMLDQVSVQVIIFQDYNKGVLTGEVISAITREARKRKIPIVVDPKKANFFAYTQAEVFKPNLKEIQEALPFEVDADIPSLTKASEYLFEKLDCKRILITLSEKGIFISDRKRFEIIPTQARNIADVCGAGDTVISMVALGITLDLPLKDIAILANLAGGQVCEKVGVVPVSKSRLKKEYLDMVLNSET